MYFFFLNKKIVSTHQLSFYFFSSFYSFFPFFPFFSFFSSFFSTTSSFISYSSSPFSSPFFSFHILPTSLIKSWRDISGFSSLITDIVSFTNKLYAVGSLFFFSEPSSVFTFFVFLTFFSPFSPSRISLNTSVSILPNSLLVYSFSMSTLVVKVVRICWVVVITRCVLISLSFFSITFFYFLHFYVHFLK